MAWPVFYAGAEGKLIKGIIIKAQGSALCPSEKSLSMCVSTRTDYAMNFLVPS